MRNYSIAGKRGQWPAPEDTSLSYLSYLIYVLFINNGDIYAILWYLCLLPLYVNKNMNRGKICLFVVILCLHRHFCTSQVYLPSIISAIDSTLQYYANNYVRMNLDGIFGLRVLEGSYGFSF